MHRCLQVPEIVAMILSYVPDGSPKPSEPSATAMAMAKTCKLFYEPSMDILWRQLEGVAPLVKCLPLHIWSEPSTNNIMFHANPTADEWRRLLTNAARVKTLHLQEQPCDKDILSFIRLGLPPDTMLFPKLKELSLNRTSLGSASHMVVTLGPQIRDIKVLATDRAATGCLMGQIAESCPDLRNLQLGAIPLEVVPSITRLRALESLRCTKDVVPAGPLLRHLANLPTLSMLSTPFPDANRILNLSLSGLFRSLRALDLYKVDNVAALNHLLRSVNPQSMKYLIIRVQFSSHPVYFRKLLATISLFKGLILLEITATPRALPSGVGVEFNNLEPLYGLKQLRVLRLEHMAVNLKNEDIPRLGEAWPELKALKIRYDLSRQVHRGIARGMNTEALGLFATHLPKLWLLSVEIDATTAPPMDIPTPRSFGSISLHLDGSLLHASSFVAVAGYISSVYPNAKDLDRFSPRNPTTELGRLYKNLVQVVQLVAAARKEGQPGLF